MSSITMQYCNMSAVVVVVQRNYTIAELYKIISAGTSLS